MLSTEALVEPDQDENDTARPPLAAASVPSLVVAIATVGRAPILCEAVKDVYKQSHQPDQVIVCATKPTDVEGLAAVAPHAEVLFGPPGSSCQRNQILEAAQATDIVLFIDDDFLMHRDYCASTLSAFIKDPQLIISTGHVLEDGINGPGIHAEAARRTLASADPAQSNINDKDTFAGYGCNMAVRMAAVHEHNVRFDERLPLYAWQEDVGFSRALAPYGRLRELSGACGIHLGTKLGRGSGKRLGYSQIANPIHLAKVSGGAYPWSYVLLRGVKNMTANIVRSLRPEPWVDRRGRLRGNLIALGDLAKGSLHPERVLDL